MTKEELKERILNEMCIDDEPSWRLAKEICKEYRGRLKKGIGLTEVYLRIVELKKEANNDRTE